MCVIDSLFVTVDTICMKTVAKCPKFVNLLKRLIFLRAIFHHFCNCDFQICKKQIKKSGKQFKFTSRKSAAII